MLISEFDFDLPEELIAQQPLENRAASRMLCLERERGTFSDSRFEFFHELIREGDVVVVNNTRVFPARLLGNSESGAAIELFLINEGAGGIWEALARPARRLKPGKKIIFREGLEAEVIEKNKDGRVFVNLSARGAIEDALEKAGKTPLPPYIKRAGGSPDADRERYQTVFAKERGAIAAPTAGLHFTPEIICKLKQQGAKIAEITLHVGYGTFEPVKVTDLSEHRVLPERYAINAETANLISESKAGGKRIIAIGTTTTRALESASDERGIIAAGNGLADLTITPGYAFRAIDGLLTNFHLPQSSLLVLVSAFAGHGLAMRSYAHAVSSRYRFYSYGDCMFII